MNEQAKNTEITLGFLWAVLRRRIIWLVLALLIGAGAAFAYTKLLVDPVYSSRAQFAVENTYESPSMMNSGYQNGAALLASSYAYEVTGNVFLGEILTEYNTRHGKEMSLAALSAMISVSAEDELPVFHVKVSSTDRQAAYDVLQIIEEKAPTLLLNESTKSYVNVKLIEYGHLASSPESPNTVLNIAIGGAVALILAYIVFFLIAFLDKTVYDEDALKNTCSVPIVGQIPQWIKKSEVGKKQVHDANIESPEKRTGSIKRDYDERLLNKETPFSVAESFKTLRTNLTYVALKDNECPVFGITSGFAGAGKSVVIANIAISFAQLGKRTLLIDGDMRCPTQHKIFGVSSELHGLSETLAGIDGKPFETCVVKNVYEGLDLMTCGHIPPNPSELLASERMQKLLEACKAEYDYVFIDLPPILETADAGVLTTLVSSYILVVRAGYSKIDAVKEVVDTMQSMRANIAGFVLNDVSARGGFGYYSHYSHYSKYQRYSRYARIEGPSTLKVPDEDTEEEGK